MIRVIAALVALTLVCAVIGAFAIAYVAVWIYVSL